MSVSTVYVVRSKIEEGYRNSNENEMLPCDLVCAKYYPGETVHQISSQSQFLATRKTLCNQSKAT